MSDEKPKHRHSPTFNLRTSDTVPNIGPRIGRAASHTLAGGPDDEGSEILPENWRSISYDAFVEQFLRWIVEHGLARTWTTDEIWFHASEDFGPANDLLPPPRRVFLGLLKRADGVRVEKDKRLRDRHGCVTSKTTMYTLPGAIVTTSTSREDEPN